MTDEWKFAKPTVHTSDGDLVSSQDKGEVKGEGQPLVPNPIELDVSESSEEEPGPPFAADFESDLDYILEKNAELYRRLAK